MRIALITGTRPQIIKSTPVIYELMKEPDVNFKFIHTGQHYDDNLFRDFITDFKLPQPFNLSVMDNDDYSFSRTVSKLLRLWKDEYEHPDLVIIPGDTDSAFAAAYAAVTSDIPIAHLESGVREYDMTMREERNRRMIDHVASLLLVPTQTGWSNLVRENVLGKMLLSGDTNLDMFMMRNPIICSNRFAEYVKSTYDIVADDEYGLLTIHRAANVDDPEILAYILKRINDTAKKFIWPVHPRARKSLEKIMSSIECKNINLIDPVSYDVMMYLLINASVVVTDSGGLQKEAYFALTPCVTLRNVTAWSETVEYGANVLVGTTRVDYGIEKQWNKRDVYPLDVFGDGRASKKIVEYILNIPIDIPRRFYGLQDCV